MYGMLTTTRLECFLLEWREAFGLLEACRHQPAALSSAATRATRRMMVILAEAASAMRFRTVRVVELFELSQGDELPFEQTNDSRPSTDHQ
jgi:hypothetical protein